MRPKTCHDFRCAWLLGEFGTNDNNPMQCGYFMTRQGSRITVFELAVDAIKQDKTFWKSLKSAMHKVKGIEEIYISSYGVSKQSQTEQEWLGRLGIASCYLVNPKL